MILCPSIIKYGNTFQMKLRTSFSVSLYYSNLCFLELLEKDRFKRISIEDVLSHQWVCKRSKNMLEARNKADLLSQFEAFSTTDYKNPQNK
jgi:hypothetical protein